MPERTTELESRSALVVCAIIGLLVLYPLSLGPAVWLHEQAWLGPESGPVVVSLRTLYRPLAWCHEQELPVVAPVLNTYVDWWRDGP